MMKVVTFFLTCEYATAIYDRYKRLKKPFLFRENGQTAQVGFRSQRIIGKEPREGRH
jgi:hypothetical protein